MIIGVLFLVFVLLLLIGVPVAIALALGAAGTLYFCTDIPLFIVAQRFFSGINSFSYMGIPMFLLAGNIMAEARISDRLVGLTSLLVGRYTGGLAHVTTGASAFFGAISGSAPATTAAIGSVMIPSMEKRGYDKAYSATVAAASGILGNIIPPSLTMVVYGVTASVSIGSLFLSGIVPGLMITFMLMLLNYVICKRRGVARETRRYTFGEAVHIFRQSVLALLVPLIILGGIYSGIFTATESAAIACLYGALVGLFAYRTLTLKSLFRVFVNSVGSTAMIFTLMGAASLFSYIIAREEVPQRLAALLLGVTTNQAAIMFIVLAGLLVVGTFLDSVGALVLVVPTLMGVVKQANIDPVYFGVFMVIALGVGLITPPVGLNLFVATNISGAKFEAIVKEVVPYIGVYILALVLFIIFPDLLTLIKL